MDLKQKSEGENECLNEAGIQKSDTKTIRNRSSVRDSSGSDIDENSLVIDLDKMTDSSQDDTNDKKMDNVFDRILSDVTFASVSLSRSTVLSRNANTDNMTSLQHKGDCEMKKESIDDTVRGLENLEHCLKEFEGKLKQNGSCSKIDGKEKTATQAVDKKTNDDDKKLQEEMDALISEFTTTVDKEQDPGMNKEKTDVNVTKTIAVEDKVSEETDANIELEKSGNIVKDNVNEMKNTDVYVEGIDGIKKLKMTDTETCVELNKSIPIVNECCETKGSDEQSNVGNKEKADEVDNSKCEDSNDKCDEPDNIVNNTETDIEIIKSESSNEENRDILSKDILTFINKHIIDIDNMVVPSYGEKTGNTEGVCAAETKDLASKDGNKVVSRKSEDETFTAGCKKYGKIFEIGSDGESNGKVNETQNQNVVGKKVCETTAPVRKISSVSDETLKQQETTAAWSKLGMQRCDICKLTTDDESLFASHSVICSRKPTKVEVAMVYSEYRFNCLNCQYSSSLRRKFEEHVALHLMAQPYICITCNITFESKKDIEVHVKVKHAKETVKCGLKGPKRIGQIIDVLINSGKHTFHGRAIDQSLPTDGKQKDKESVQSAGIVPSSTTIPPQSLVQPRATSAVSSDTGSTNVVFVSSTATTTSTCSLLSSKHNEVTILKSTLPQNTITTQGPLILVPVNNMNGMFIPLSNVPTQPVQPVQTSAVIGSASSGNNQLNFQNIPYRFSTQNITIQGNTLQSNTIPKGTTVPNTSNSSQMNGPAKTLSMQNTQPKYVILPPGNLPSIVQTSLPVTNQQNNQVMNIPTLIPYKNIESNQRNLVSLLGATSIRPTIVQAQSQNSFSLTTPGISPKSVSNTNAIGISTALPVVAISQSPTTVLPSTTDSNSGMSVKSSVVDTDGKKLYFRKSGELYMCDFCKSETPLEDSFKEHIWKHFHQLQKICKDCPVPYDSSIACKIVVKVMMGLLNSALELSTQNQTKDVVMISDDEEDNSDIKERDRNDRSQKDEEKKQNEKEEAVVTIDSGGSTPTDELDLQIKITNTFSLSESDKLNVEKTETSTSRQEDIKKDKNNVDINKTTADMAKDVFDGKESNATKNDEDSPRLPSTVKEREDNYSTVDEKESTLVSSELHRNECSYEDMLKSVEEGSTTKEKRNTKLNEKTPEDEEHLKSTSEMETNDNIREKEEQMTNDNIGEKDGQTTNDNIGGKEKQTELPNGSKLSISQTTEQDESLNEGQTNERKCFETLQDLTNCNTVKTIAERESTIATETDRKPIAFPLVAFYKCGIDSCSFDAATSHEFREHLSQCHRDVLEYKCAHCGQKSFTEDSHIRHLLFHSKPQNSLLFHCGVIGCRFRANILHIYKEHLEQAHQNVLLYRCHSCKDGFTSVALLVEHLQNNLLKFVQCPYCTMKDGVRRNVLMHITSFHPGKPRQINVTSQLICQERETNEFEKPFPKLEHQDISSNEVKMSDSAPQHLTNEGKTEEHKSMLSDLTENDPEDTEMINKIISNPSIMGATYYRCNSCTYLGIGHTKLNKHLEMHKAGFVQQSQRTFVCPECPQSVNILQQFISHLNLHVGEHVCYIYICQHCGFGTNLSNKIQQHVTETHGSNKLGKDYTERTIRFSVKTIFCTKCNAAFKTSQAHRDHVLKSHGITTNEMSGKDDLESQKTQSLKDFHEENKEKHVSPPQLSQHNEEDVSKRRFTCNECGWATRKLSFLKHHVKRHFPTQDRCQITLFRCNYCEFTSTSKLIINGHSQNMHPGKLLRVKRVIETVYITESPEGDLSIDKFHCDMCTFSCDKVSTLQSHLRDSHSGKKNLDESTKPTYVGPKQEFLIPSGTVFKDVIQCSMCTFRTKRRIELLRHIKIHPSLEPKTETPPAKDQQHSDKVQNPLFESFYKLGMKRRASSDGNPIVKKPCPLSPTMPYDRIKMDAAARDTGYRKQVATKSTTNHRDASIKSMLYFLGGEQLHMKLKPCISEFKDASQYYCLICSDVFGEKFNLHKHILQHMKVHFYKCAYCDHGTLDQTLVMVHIQRMHRRAIQYSKLDVEEIDSHINKAIHDMKSQVGSGKEKITFEEMPKDTKSQLLHKNEKKDELKWIIPEKAKEVTSEKTEDNSMTNGNVEEEKDTTHTKIKQEKISSNKQEKVSPIKHFQKENTFKHWGNTGDGTKDIDNDPTKDVSENENAVTEIQNNASLMLHPKVKNIDDIFKCTICKNEFNTRSAANSHIFMHSKVRRFMCSICLFDYVSRWRGDIKKHIDAKHKMNNKAECLWDDVTACDLTDDGLPFFEFKYNSKLTPPALLSEFNAIKKECEEIKEEVQSEIADIKLNCPSKRPIKIKLCLGNKTEKKPVHIHNFLNMYKCLVCTKTFRSKHAIHQHLRKDCRDPLFGCSLCKFKDVDESKVKKHLKNNHESDNGEVITRTRNHKIRLYKVPIRSDSSKVSAKSEDKGNKSTTGVLFKCVACKRTFKNRSACWYHAISALCNKTIKKCSQCEFKDVASEQVESHIKKNHKEKGVKVVELPKEAKIEMITAPSSAKMNRNKTGNITFFFKQNGEYKCRICDFRCQDVPSVIQHQNMHNSSPAYGCPYCNVLKSNYTKSVKNHVRLRHSGKAVKIKTLRNDIGTGNRKETSNTASTKEVSLEKKCVVHKCLQCNYRCETYSGLFRHIKRTESCNVPRFKCKECQKYTSLNEIEVVEHMKNVHNSKEMPEVCPIKEMMKIIKVKKKSSEDSSKVIKTDKNDRTDKSRIIEKFSGMKDIETQVITCPKVSCNFKDKVIKVLEHYRKDHPTRIMKCKMCHFSSKSLGIMFMHFKDFHKLEDYYSTSFLVCAKTREERERVEKAEKIEEEKQIVKNALLKSYKCNRCTYAAYNKHGMRIHLYRHLNYKRFLCRLCKADFIIRPYLEKHLTAVHSTDSDEIDEIKNERIEKEVEDILKKSIVWKPKEGIDKDQDRSPTQNKMKKKENSKQELKKTTDSKKEKNKEELESVDKTGLKKHNSETTLKLKVDFTKFGTDVFNQSNYIKEVQNRKTKEMEYSCTKCPYKSIARHCALGHTYKHMPKCMKCPYCNFHGYPR